MAPQPPPPTLAEILAAMSALRPAEPQGERGIAKHAGSIVSAIILAICLWVGASVTGVGTNVTRMTEQMGALQKDVGDLKVGQDKATSQMGDMKAAVAKQDARVDAIEADVGRTKERVRLLEGQPPIGHLSRDPGGY